MTRNVIVAWNEKGARLFERSTPLRFAGTRNQQLGFDNDFDVVFLYGLDTLESGYKEELRSLGYRIHDASGLYHRLRHEYAILERFGKFELNCFLRWLVLDELFRGEAVIHYDGDVVMNEAPRTLAQKVGSSTFVLQGCPAMTAISNSNWFPVYRRELDKFAADISGYSQAAWKLREGWEKTLISKWAGSRFREIISSDQDLLSHLIHSDILPQDPPREIESKLRDYVLFENPLYIHEVHPNQRFEYRRDNMIDYLNGRRVAIWHMQSDWVGYLVKFLNRKKVLLAGATLENRRGNVEDLVSRGLRKLTLGASSARLRVYRYFFDKADFSQVLNNSVWWKKGIFE